jgi:hypothetical protein
MFNVSKNPLYLIVLRIFFIAFLFGSFKNFVILNNILINSLLRRRLHIFIISLKDVNLFG